MLLRPSFFDLREFFQFRIATSEHEDLINQKGAGNQHQTVSMQASGIAIFLQHSLCPMDGGIPENFCCAPQDPQPEKN